MRFACSLCADDNLVIRVHFRIDFIIAVVIPVAFLLNKDAVLQKRNIF